MARVLVLGDDGRSCLSVVRSLGRNGIEIILGTQSSGSIVRYSRFVSRTIQMESTEHFPREWLDSLQKLLLKEQFDLVIPCSDNTLVPIAENREKLPTSIPFAIPDHKGFLYTYYKNKTIELAKELSVPVPETILIQQTDQMPIQDLKFPIIVKPVCSKIWRNGRRFDLRVKTAEDQSQLERLVEDRLNFCPVLIQNYFVGIGVGQEFLVNKGRIIRSFQHERIHEPTSGGGSSYRKSVPLNERMLHHSTRMLGALEYTGVAMVEYRQNLQTGEFVLLEINGRFWGSLPLAISAGVDFPMDYFKMMMGHEVHSSDSYRINYYNRNVVRDWGWWLQRIRKEGKNVSNLMKLIPDSFGELKNIFVGRESWDTFSWSDPVPAIVETVKEIGKSAAKIRKKMSRPAALSAKRIQKAKDLSRLQNLLVTNPNILFICRGNICRSPFAEEYMLEQVRSKPFEVTISSAGTYEIDQRLPPKEARAIASEFGINLNDHRSRSVSKDMLKTAALIFCMDYRDYHEIERIYPPAIEKAFFLKSLLSSSDSLEIQDPWGKSMDAFRESYNAIAACIDRLIPMLDQSKLREPCHEKM